VKGSYREYLVSYQGYYVQWRIKRLHMLLKEIRKILQQNKKDLSRLGVRALALFGSVVRHEATSKSDVDILIEFDATKGLLEFVGVKRFLEKILDCEVDLVTKNALHPALKHRILKEAQYVF
jgi:hypothetical protein